nr:DUF4434 domain-containing protein [Psychromicrobium silvestre]
MALLVSPKAQAATGENPPRLGSSFIEPQTVVSWDAVRWDQETHSMLEAGMDSMSLTFSINDNSKISYYPTSLKGYTQSIANGRQVDVLGAMLAAAKRANMTVWIGLQADSPTWFSTGQLDASWLSAQATLFGKVAQDIWNKYGGSYQGTISGWYEPYENNNYDAIVGTVNRPQLMHTFFRQLSSALGKVSKDGRAVRKPVMISPYYLRELENSTDYRDFWRIALRDTSISVVALQVDAYLKPGSQQDEESRTEVISQWVQSVSQGVAEAGNGAVSWANIELFQHDYSTATVRYMLTAIQAAAPFVSGFTSYSFASRWSPWSIGYNWYLQAYRDYLDSGLIPSAQVNPPTMISVSRNGTVLDLRWNAPEPGRYQVVSYAVYALSSNIRVATAGWDASGVSIAVTPGESYVIQAVDAAGDVSPLVSLS